MIKNIWAEGDFKRVNTPPSSGSCSASSAYQNLPLSVAQYGELLPSYGLDATIVNGTYQSKVEDSQIH